MSAVKNKGPVFDPGLCRCCGNMKKCRVLNVEYESCGQKEIYSDMIMDCFGLLLSHLDGSPSERLICATCVNRIRDALSFCRQVLKCEEAFLKMKIYDANDNPNSIQPKCVDVLVDAPEKPYIEVEVVKAEPEEVNVQEHHNDSGYTLDAPVPDDDSSDDDRPLKIVEKASSSPSAPSTPEKKKIKDISGAAALANQIMITRQTFAKKMRRNANNRARAKRPPDGEAVTWESPETDDVHMSKIQQEMRERDPGYKRETNILTILEYSYVCPFKCRHNHLLCYYCGELFSDPVLLRDHTLNSHHPKKFKVIENRSMVKVDLTRIDCRLCPIKIDNLDEFRRHVTSVHEKKYYTDIKDAVLPFRLNRDELKCAICDVLFPYFHALNKHMNEHYSNYVCETCGLGFVDHARFMMHQQRHDEGEFPCPTCGKVFKAQYNRDLHVDRVHHKKGRVYCPKCDVKLMSYPQKLKHLVEVHGEQPLSFPCESCDRVFDSRRILTIHRRKDHLKDYRYECQCCGQKFFTRFALTNHMPTHTGERNFKCKVCDKSYPRLKTLKDHMRIHTNDRRFRCHVCGQAFIQNCSLKGHMKSQHPEYG